MDALYNVCAAGHYAGVRLLYAERPKLKFERTQPLPPEVKPRHPWINRDGWQGLRHY